MSASFSRQSSRQSSRSYSARSVTSSSLSQRGGMQQSVGGMQQSVGGFQQSVGGFQQSVGGSQGFLLSTGGPLMQGRSPSVYGGAGGYGTRISQSFYTSGSHNPFSESAVIFNEKLTMQNLNDRLESYLQQVHSLESANRRLELQIREFLEKRAPSHSNDFTKFFAIITDVRAQILNKYLDNQRITLQIDNAQLAAEDFQVKYEVELNMHSTVQADVIRLKGVRDSLTLSISDLELNIEGMKEELVYMRSSHQEVRANQILCCRGCFTACSVLKYNGVAVIRKQQSGSVDVRVQCAESVDIEKELKETREEYEGLMVKNMQEVEKWFQAKVEEFNVRILVSTTDVNTFYTELSELRRTYQNLEISRDGILTEIQCRQRTLEESNVRFNTQLNQLQLSINTLQGELQGLQGSIEQQQTEYRILLDIKMRLEMEIAEYRRLLDGETRERVVIQERKAFVIKEVVQVEEHTPHIERRTKTIVEEIIDGQVVSSSEQTKTVDIQ
ncbi:Keratin type I cytoskeletal 47 kDa [Dissostichus eleginoides]|uniref:Keratin type I cytoskeletal 47 kDa n=1 Tax=Dissostichus eleginoides TaxID=100907 RepID=A0AAD9BPS0_DISEL|nr:Keratin type I cytoskeletal 47 kDa [Dissostichus eleginoides]